MQEYDYDGHNNEYISYIVIESGKFTLPDGSKIEAGTIDVPASATHESGEGVDDYVNVNFTQTFSSDPSFFASLNTYGNADYMSCGSADVTVSGSKVFQELGRAPQTPADEVVGWLAIDRGISSYIANTLYESGAANDGTNDGVTDGTPHEITYTHTYT